MWIGSSKFDSQILKLMQLICMKRSRSDYYEILGSDANDTEDDDEDSCSEDSQEESDDEDSECEDSEDFVEF